MPGFRQRLSRDGIGERSRSPQHGLRPQLKGWVQKWAWGKFSAADVARSADDYVEEHGRRGTDKNILRLARTCSNLQNAERVVESIVLADDMVAPVAVPDSLVEVIMPPYDFFHWLLRANPLRFKTHLGAKPEGLQDWWTTLKSSAKGEELWAAHPWLQHRCPADLKWHVPLMVFDDAGPVSHTNSTFCRCFYSVLGMGSEKETRFLIGTGLKSNEEPDLSWGPIMDSFGKLALPVDRDSDAGNWGGVLLFVGCDLEYACNVLGLPHFNSATQCCADCEANASDKPYNNFGSESPWRRTIRTNEGYLRALRRPLHPLVGHAFFNRQTYRFDLLHMMNHHGVSNHITANILWQRLSG